MAIISSDRNADDEEEEEEEEGTTDYGDLCATRLEVERRGEERRGGYKLKLPMKTLIIGES